MLLIVYRDNFADEFDVEGFRIFSGHHEVSEFLNRVKYGVYPHGVLAGNYSWAYENPDKLLDCYSVYTVSSGTINEMKKQLSIGDTFGFFVSAPEFPATQEYENHKHKTVCPQCFKEMWGYIDADLHQIPNSTKLYYTLRVGSHFEEGADTLCPGSNKEYADIAVDE